MPFILKKTITETFLERVKTTPNLTGYRFKPTYEEMGPVGQWTNKTFREFYDECRLISFGLMGLDLAAQDKAVILSNTRYEWALADLAILGAGAVTVPIYASNTPADIAFILNHCEAKVVFLENAKQLEKIFEIRDDLKFLEKIVVFDPAAMKLAVGRSDVLSLQALKELGRRVEAKDPQRFDRLLQAAEPHDLLTICYTSGTTGVPKGVMLTHDNLMSVMEDCVHLLNRQVESEKEVMITFLPFSHIIGKCESMATFVFGWQESFAENIDMLVANMAEIRPTLMFAVPRIFEKAYSRVQAQVHGSSTVKQMLFKKAVSLGREYFGYTKHHDENSPLGRMIAKNLKPVMDLTLAAEYQIFKKIVFSKVMDRFGGRLKYAICGGAPLPREMGEFFNMVGLPILEGYGLTETCAPITINTPEDPRFGTVGRPLPDVLIKIAEDGEILAKSRKVFKGYFKMPEETAEVMQGGWFHTGDIGHIDDDGFLKITDRKKDIIVTSGGKNIAPQKIENVAKAKKYVAQFVVHGDRRNYLTALVVLDHESVIHYATTHQILFSEFSELVRHPKIRALVQKIVDELNSELASFETIKKFMILPHDFTIETGELTPSLKVKRSFINQKYKYELDSMYSG